MNNSVRGYVKSFFDIEKSEVMKVILLSIAFFLIIGAYTIAREVKDSLFVHIVGKTYIPLAKIISMILLVPAIFLYSKLVDVLRKHQLLYFYTVLYGIVGLIIAYFLAHPTIGLINTHPSKDRLFGWIIYMFIEGYPPFVASLFWAFSNSITSPEAAKSNYPIMIAASKIGGIIAAGCALFLLQKSLSAHTLSIDIINHQLLLILASIFLLLVPVVIYYLMKKVPSQSLHGYEASYQAEKDHAQENQSKNFFSQLFSGLTLLVRYPYILGIFGMVFFWEVINSVFGYERLGVGKTVSLTMSDYTRFLFEGMILSHAVGFFIALFGTKFIIKYFGERRSLILVPVITGILMLYYLSAKSATAVVAVFVLIRAIEKSYANPLRESLYIPTTKEVRFKSKSWIDAFGAKFAKAAGSSYNMVIASLAPAFVDTAHFMFFGSVIGVWILIAHFLGKRFEKAVQHNEVIGLDKA